MERIKKYICLTLFLSGAFLYSQQNESGAVPPTPSEIPSSRFVEPEQTPQIFSPVEIKAVCNKWEGKVIGSYSELFIVEKCKRRKIESQDFILDLHQKKIKIHEVENDVIAKLPEGDVLETRNMVKRSCSQLEGSYITYSYVDVYYIEKCKKRLIPDYETFDAHKKKMKKEKNPLIGLSVEEFFNLVEGEPVTSITDEEFKKELKYGLSVDVIPIDEACRGVNNQYVSYYSKIYKIEKCKKREIDAEEATFKKILSNKLIELTSEQWISLPDGERIKL